MKNHILTSMLIAFALPTSAHAGCNTLAGRWVNARGSAMVLENVKPHTGQFYGRFVSEVSIDDAAAFPLIGWSNETAPTKTRPHVVRALSFMVRWDKTGSITAWTGYCRATKDTTEIVTLWHLVRSTSENDFDHIHAGSDIFVQQESRP